LEGGDGSAKEDSNGRLEAASAASELAALMAICICGICFASKGFGRGRIGRGKNSHE
jgi:hypothetical protein